MQTVYHLGNNEKKMQMSSTVFPDYFLPTFNWSQWYRTHKYGEPATLVLQIIK